MGWIIPIMLCNHHWMIICVVSAFILITSKRFWKKLTFVGLNGWVSSNCLFQPEENRAQTTQHVKRITESEQHLNHHHGRCWTMLSVFHHYTINKCHTFKVGNCLWGDMRVCVWNNSNMKFPLFVLDTKHAFLFLNNSCVYFIPISFPTRNSASFLVS